MIAHVQVMMISANDSNNNNTNNNSTHSTEAASAQQSNSSGKAVKHNWHQQSLLATLTTKWNITICMLMIAESIA
jgi:hypothetical protein